MGLEDMTLAEIRREKEAAEARILAVIYREFIGLKAMGIIVRGVRVSIEDVSTLFSADCVVGDVKLDLGDI